MPLQAVNLARPRAAQQSNGNNNNNADGDVQDGHFRATPEELRSIHDKMRDPVFAKLMHEYMQSLSDPDTLREEQAYLEQVEREANEGGDYSFEFIFPSPRFVVELREPTTRRVTREQARSVALVGSSDSSSSSTTTTAAVAATKTSSSSSSSSATDAAAAVVSKTARSYINMCVSDKIEPFREETTGDRRGSNWHVPVSVSAKRVELYTPHNSSSSSSNNNNTHTAEAAGAAADDEQALCFVYDAVFHPTTLSLADRSDRFLCFLVEIAVEHINAGYKEDNGFAFTRLPRAVCSVGKPRSQTVRRQTSAHGGSSSSSNKTTITASADAVLTRPTRHIDADTTAATTRDDKTKTKKKQQQSDASDTPLSQQQQQQQSPPSSTMTTSAAMTQPQLPPYTITHRGFVDLSDTWSDTRLQHTSATATTTATTAQQTTTTTTAGALYAPRAGVPDVLVVTMTFPATVTRAAQLDVQLSDDGTTVQLAATPAQPRYAGVLVLPFTVQPTPQRAAFDRTRHVLTLELRVVPPRMVLIKQSATTTDAATRAHDDDHDKDDEATEATETAAAVTACSAAHVEQTTTTAPTTTVDAEHTTATATPSTEADGRDDDETDKNTTKAAAATVCANADAHEKNNNSDDSNKNNTAQSRSSSSELPALTPVLDCMQSDVCTPPPHDEQEQQPSATTTITATTTVTHDAASCANDGDEAVSADAPQCDTNATARDGAEASVAATTQDNAAAAAAAAAAAELSQLHASQDAWRSAQLRQAAEAEAAAAVAEQAAAAAAAHKAQAEVHAQRAAEQREAAAQARMQQLPLRNAYIFAID